MSAKPKSASGAGPRPKQEQNVQSVYAEVKPGVISHSAGAPVFFSLTNSPQASLQRGAQVVFGSYQGQEIKIDGQEYLILRGSDVVESSESRSPSENLPQDRVIADIATLLRDVDAIFRLPMTERADNADSHRVDVTSTNLNVERAAYERDLSEMLGSSSGQYALYVGSCRVGIFATYSDALSAGYDATFGRRPFLARRIELVEDDAGTWEHERVID